MSAEQGDQQFCLRWNDFQTNMVASFKHLRDEKSFCDVTIATEGQHTKAHKMILCACRYFWSYYNFLLLQRFLPAVRISRICWSRTPPSTRSSFWKMFPSPISPPSWSSCTPGRSMLLRLNSHFSPDCTFNFSLRISYPLSWRLPKSWRLRASPRVSRERRMIPKCSDFIFIYQFQLLCDQ